MRRQKGLQSHSLTYPEQPSRRAGPPRLMPAFSATQRGKEFSWRILCGLGICRRAPEDTAREAGGSASWGVAVGAHVRPWTLPRAMRLQRSFSCGPSFAFQSHRKLKLPPAVRFPGSASAARFELQPPPVGSTEMAPCNFRRRISLVPSTASFTALRARARSVMTALAERLFARECAYPQFPSAGGAQQSRRGTRPQA